MTRCTATYCQTSEQCKREAEPGSSLCAFHEQMRDRGDPAYPRRVMRCIDCGVPVGFYQRRCDVHREERRRLAAKRARERGRSGRCSECGGQCKRGSARCAKCRRDGYVARAAERNRRRIEEHLAAMASHKKPCDECYDQPWRVAGIRCRCGLRYAPEQMPTLDEYLERRTDRTVWPDMRGVAER